MTAVSVWRRPTPRSSPPATTCRPMLAAAIEGSRASRRAGSRSSARPIHAALLRLADLAVLSDGRVTAAEKDDSGLARAPVSRAHRRVRCSGAAVSPHHGRRSTRHRAASTRGRRSRRTIGPESGRAAARRRSARLPRHHARSLGLDDGAGRRHARGSKRISRRRCSAARRCSAPHGLRVALASRRRQKSRWTSRSCPPVSCPISGGGPPHVPPGAAVSRTCYTALQGRIRRRSKSEDAHPSRPSSSAATADQRAARPTVAPTTTASTAAPSKTAEYARRRSAEEGHRHHLPATVGGIWRAEGAWNRAVPSWLTALSSSGGASITEEGPTSAAVFLSGRASLAQSRLSAGKEGQGRAGRLARPALGATDVRRSSRTSARAIENGAPLRRRHRARPAQFGTVRCSQRMALRPRAESGRDPRPRLSPGLGQRRARKEGAERPADQSGSPPDAALPAPARATRARADAWSR